MPPWAVYPFSPALCARLITDYAMYIVTMSSEAVLAALDDIGLAAEWALLPRTGEDRAAGRRRCALTQTAGQSNCAGRRCNEACCWSWRSFQVWVQSVTRLLAHAGTGRRPWTSFAEESEGVGVVASDQHMVAPRASMRISLDAVLGSDF